MCNLVNIKLPNDELTNESIPYESRIHIFSKLSTVLKDKHSFCYPQCNHLAFL